MARPFEDGEMRQIVLTHKVIWDEIEQMLGSRGIDLVEVKSVGDEPFWIISPRVLRTD